MCVLPSELQDSFINVFFRLLAGRLCSSFRALRALPLFSFSPAPRHTPPDLEAAAPAAPHHEMATSSSIVMSPATIVPAQVGFLAVFNPSLGNTDDTLDDQIVYYSSVDVSAQKRRRPSCRRGSAAGRPTENVSQAERNERLRQIGLAQGMVEFGKNFSGDQSVDTIETEKTRVVLHELEPGWWILAVCFRNSIHSV